LVKPLVLKSGFGYFQ